LDGTSASKGDKIAKEFADYLKERFKPIELVTDEGTASQAQLINPEQGPWA